MPSGQRKRRIRANPLLRRKRQRRRLGNPDAGRTLRTGPYPARSRTALWGDGHPAALPSACRPHHPSFCRTFRRPGQTSIGRGFPLVQFIEREPAHRCHALHGGHGRPCVIGLFGPAQRKVDRSRRRPVGFPFPRNVPARNVFEPHGGTENPSAL